MNNKGFAITGFIYTIFVIFIILMIAILNMFNARKNLLDKLKNDAINEVNKKANITNIQKYEAQNEIQEFNAYRSGFYKIYITSPNGAVVNTLATFEIYLNKSEVLYLKIGNAEYNNNEILVSFDKKFQNNIAETITSLSNSTVENKHLKVVNNRVVYNYNVEEIDNKNGGSVEIIAINKTKENEDLNRVQYIKDCTHGGNGKIPNSWAEFKVFVNGQNIVNVNNINVSTDSNMNINNMIDDDINTYYMVTTDDEACALIDLGRTYNVDSIQIIHEVGATTYGNKLSVSSDNKDYRVIRNIDELEDQNGVIVDAYDYKQVQHVGDVYAPVKTFEGARWLRIFHHDLLDGTLFWDAKAQVLTNGGYESLHKQSILYALENYRNKNNQFEFLLEYSDIPGYNRWIQTSNPITTSEDVTGYKSVKTSWTSTSWYGLALSNSGSTVLDGNKGNNWWYAVGVISPHQGGVPVYSGNISKETTDLWVRIDNLK